MHTRPLCHSISQVIIDSELGRWTPELYLRDLYSLLNDIKLHQLNTYV